LNKKRFQQFAGTNVTVAIDKGYCFRGYLAITMRGAKKDVRPLDLNAASTAIAALGNPRYPKGCTGEATAQHLLDIRQRLWTDYKINAAYIVTDNAANMLKMQRLVGNNVIGIPCTAHTIALLFSNVCEDVPLFAPLKKKVLQCQKALMQKEPELRLTQFCETRWISICNVMQDMFEKNPASTPTPH